MSQDMYHLFSVYLNAIFTVIGLIWNFLFFFVSVLYQCVSLVM